MEHLTRIMWGTMLWLGASLAANAAQIVTPSQTSVSVSTEAFAFTPVYAVSSPASETMAGLGIRIHFNSSALQLNGVSNTYAYGLQPVGSVTADTENFDNDPATDRYFVVGWVDLIARWPGTGMTPQDLLTATFQPQNGFTGTTNIRTTATSTAGEAVFQSTAMNVTVTAPLAEPAVQVRAFLQGAYVAADGKMRDSLREADLLPLAQPYAGWGYTGTETTTSTILATSGDNAPVAWVLLELRDSADPQTVVASKAALLQRDGDVVAAADASATVSFPGVAAGNYYLTLRHRNHLGIMTAVPLAFSGTPVAVDFANPATPVYGDADIRLLSGSNSLLPTGDASNDNRLIAAGPETDKNAVLGVVLISAENVDANTNFQHSGYNVTDLNMDGKTIFAGPNNDINILLGNVLLDAGNTTASTNYIVRGSLP